MKILLINTEVILSQEVDNYGPFSWESVTQAPLLFTNDHKLIPYKKTFIYFLVVLFFICCS